MTTSRRAPAMPPAERRRAIVAATLPLLEKYGRAVTTRQIALAAGIAEGTVFRAFADKESLLKEAVETAFDPELALRDLDTVSPQLPLEVRVLSIVIILQTRLDRIFTLITSLGLPPPKDTPTPGAAHRVHGGDPIMTRVEALLEPDADAFRHDVRTSVKRLRLIVFAATHPRITHEEQLTAAQIVDVFLYGSLAADRRQEVPSASRGAAAC